MELQDFLSRLEGVKKTGGNQWEAKCPAHDDRKASLSVSVGENKKIVLFCHAGCDMERDVLPAMGLKKSDLVQSDPHPQAYKPRTVEAEYIYSPFLKKVKYRYEDGSKDFSWHHMKNGRWENGKGGHEIPLYNEIALASAETVYIVEGEKDVETMKRLNLPAVSTPGGAGAKWKEAYTSRFKDLNVIILHDNDQPGKKAAQAVATALNGTANSIKVIDLTREWPALPEKGDISDAAAMQADTRDKLDALVMTTEEWNAEKDDPFLSCFKTLDTFEEEEATWLVPGWIPEGQITLMAADGGIGKTTVWCNIISAISSGTRCILDPPGHTRKPEKVGFLTTEDSIRKKLRKKLRLAGANARNIITPDFLADKEGLLRDLKFSTDEMKRFISSFRLVLCIFDPVQGFIPPDINMGSRNAMRDCMAPLIALGEEYGTTFLVVCHTNKRKGAYGRDRIADSADLWDIFRSVIMAGYTEDQGIRYLSNEKNNYTQLQKTILFSIDGNGQIQREGTTWKRDREYMAEAITAKTAPKREDCKEFILHALDEAGGSVKVKELEDDAAACGYSVRTLRRAKDELKHDRTIKFSTVGSAKNGDRAWYIEMAKFTEVPPDFQNPFTPPSERGKRTN